MALKLSISEVTGEMTRELCVIITDGGAEFSMPGWMTAVLPTRCMKAMYAASQLQTDMSV
jgi:hypothetical protein